MKAFWPPSATPEAPVNAEALSADTACPEGTEKLRLKTVFPIYQSGDGNEQKKPKSLESSYVCPSCRVALANIAVRSHL